MEPYTQSAYLSLLRNAINLTQVPFSDRGARLLIYQYPQKSQLYVKLAERISGLEPGLEDYLQRPPFIDYLELTDAEGNSLDFEVETTPYAIFLKTRLGEFGLVFQDLRTLLFHIPETCTAGLRFHVRPSYWKTNGAGGELKFIRNLGYTSNGEIIHNQIRPDRGGYTIEVLVKGCGDCGISLHVSSSIQVNHPTLPFSDAFHVAKKRWEAWFDHLPPVKPEYRQTT